ncbi:ATPase, T2SS/T4P/T4SS family [Defluviimonas salinarum]|nr:ATPase, T2SS/T4P/T4SS family [Defluviimonas salinarum]
MSTGGAASKLADYNFIDMYISSDPLAPIMARGLRSATIGVTAFGKGLTRIPEVLVSDAIELHKTIERKWRHSDFKREFVVAHDDRSYRCSLIAPPDFGFAGTVEPSPENGVRWCIRQVSSKIPTFSDLGLPKWAQEDLAELLIQRGLVLISGPFASGKTTLASSVLDYWVAESRDVGIALEDPPEIPLARETDDRGVIYQIDLLDKSVREAIKHSRRWSPRYVFLGEVRTSDVSSELMHMAISGPLVICTIHASDPVQAIVSLFRFTSGAMSEDMARDMIAASLRQVFHQEIIGGRVMLKTAKIHGTDNHLIRAKIKAGNFRGLYEDFERQVINRSSPPR